MLGNCSSSQAQNKHTNHLVYLLILYSWDANKAGKMSEKIELLKQKNYSFNHYSNPPLKQNQTHLWTHAHAISHFVW